MTQGHQLNNSRPHMARPHTSAAASGLPRGQFANMTQHERERMFSKENAQAELKRQLDEQIAEKARRKREEEEKERITKIERVFVIVSWGQTFLDDFQKQVLADCSVDATFGQVT